MKKIKNIKVDNAFENNLKNLSLDIPKWTVCGICGVSGSGKSSLACDVIAKYALHAFSVSLPVKLRKKIENGREIKVDQIKYLPPVVLVDIKNANRSIRSTVATTSGLMSILRNMFSLMGKEQGDSKRTLYPRLFSYNIQESKGGGACPHCEGTGKADGIQVSSILKNEQKSLFTDAFSVINEKGIKYTKVSDLFIRAACAYKEIDIDKPISSYTKEELDYLLFGSEELVKFTDRTGANGGKKELAFPGVIPALLEVYKKNKNENIGKFITGGACTYCKGTRYNRSALSHKINNHTIADYLNLSISEAKREIESLVVLYGKEYGGFAEEFSEIASELERIGVGYLTLNREIASLSGGELQRIKLAKQLAMKLENICYVIDEPSSGLHDSNIVDLMNSIQRLRNLHNTVLLVEHNPLILNACDYLIELGPVGGSQGGNLIASGTPEEIIEKATLTGEMLKKTHQYSSESCISTSQKLGIYGVSVNNLQSVNLEIPLESFVTIVGVSGSGKSSAVNTALFDAVDEYLKTGEKKYSLSIDQTVKHIVKLNQNASVANSRSTVATILGVLDTIRKIYASLPLSKELGFDTSAFSKNGKNGACPNCAGSGVIVDEDQNEEICDFCNGSGYAKDILRIKYKGFNISELLALSIDDLTKIIEEPNVEKILKACQDLGLAYLSLDRKTPTLSKGEYQRVRLVTEICKAENKATVYILDEPSKGLHYADVDKIIGTLKRIVQEGNTVIAIEHNIDLIMNSDYIVEFGPGAGKDGGKIVYSGKIEGLKKAKTKTADAILGYKSPRQPDFGATEESGCFEVENSLFHFSLKKDCINVLRGKIASGKSSLLRDTLFANPLKRYLISVSNQGKYITRDIFAEKNKGPALPLSRLINEDTGVFGKNERVAETLNLSSKIEKMFYCSGKHPEDLVRSTFNFAKKSGKCSSCGGAGRFSYYDFEGIRRDADLEKDLYSLIADRTRLSRIAPLLKSEYGIDISQRIAEMSEEEKQIFLFGDRNKTVYYAPKKKEYFWEGCNSILYSNMSYASDSLREYCKNSFQRRKCCYCEGLGIAKRAQASEYRGLRYNAFVQTPVGDLYSILKQNEKEVEEDENSFLMVLNTMLRFGLGDLRLCDYTAELPVEKRMILQYILYRLNSLSDTLLCWDNFGSIDNLTVRDNILGDIREAIKEGMQVLLVDNRLSAQELHEVIIGDWEKAGTKEEFLFDRIRITRGAKIGASNALTPISVKDSFGNYTEVLSLVREAYKKKYPKFSFSGLKEAEKCDKCAGQGYYDVNVGDIGINRCVCPDCLGSGFSQEINACHISGENFGQVIRLPLNRLYHWCEESKFNKLAAILEIYLNMGLERISLCERIQDFSSNEKILLGITSFLTSSDHEAVIEDFSLNMSQNEYFSILQRMDTELMKRDKKIVIVER